jgi:phosphatidylserine decarboxylase
MFPVAPEGRLFVVGTAWLAVITLLFNYTEAGLLLVTLAFALMLLFRDFVRRVPADALGVVAPADGTVQSVEEARDPFTGKPAWRIVIRQRPLGEYNLNAPQEATLVKRVWPGKETEVEADPQLDGRLGLAFETDEGHAFALALDLRRWPRFVRISAITGNRIGRGKRLGFAGFGGDVVLWLPLRSSVSTRPGQRVLGGADLLGDLPGQGQPSRETAEP